MRNIVVRSSRVLLTLSGIGILGMVIGYLYFSGIASTDRLFFGFSYEIIYAFSFFLLIIGFFPVLAAGDIDAKKSIKKIYVHLLLLLGFGFIFLIYSFLVYWDRLAPFNPSHTWFDYAIVATILIVFTLSALLFSVQNKERLWNFKILYGVLIIFGFLVLIVSTVAYGGYLDSIIDEGIITWEILLIIAGILLFIGLMPLIINASTNFRDILYKLRIIWLIGLLPAILLLVIAGLINAGFVDSSVFLNIQWEVFYLYGSLLTVILLLFLAGAKNLHETLYKLRAIWLLSFLIGILVVLFSFIVILPTSPDISNIIGSFGLEMYYDVSYMYGIAITIFSLIFICSVVYFETEELVDSSGISGASDLISESETTPGEMIAYLEIIQKSNENTINHFKEALREDKFRPRVYETLIKRHQDSNRAMKTKLEKLKSKSPLVSKDEPVSSLFDVALGTKSETPTPPPSSTPTAPPKPTPKGPPMPPKSAPSPPPTTPSMAAPLPTTPSMPSPPPPTLGTTPEKSPQSPLDLIADARSTSIAELRGEMLKELRRLREIFKEE